MKTFISIQTGLFISGLISYYYGCDLHIIINNTIAITAGFYFRIWCENFETKK